jgi:hypothetical protein
LTPLRIGCLAWGSLLWDPRTLPLAEPFRSNGPSLPIEFSRVALDGRVTLVIDPAALGTQTYWAPLAVASLDEAVEGLGLRESIAPEKWSDWIGLESRLDPVVASGRADPLVRERIVDWLCEQSLDAVVWTALPSRRPNGTETRPGVEELLTHLNSLSGEARARAEEYIRRAPHSLRTLHRARFEEDLGWVSAAGGDQD